jgi:hypothetical protein
MAFRISDGSPVAQVVELAAGYAIGSATAAIVDPFLQPLRNELWTVAVGSEGTSIPTDVTTLALLVRMGLIDQAAAEHLAAQQGHNPDSLARYLHATRSVPGVGELLELHRRRRMPTEALVEALHRGGVDPRYAADLADLSRVLLSPADLAMMRQQSFISADEQVSRSALQGVDAEDAHLLFEISGEPPGPETMIELWRRGKVTEAEVRQAVVEGRLKLKWTDAILALREVPLSPAVAAEAVVRERPLPRDPHYYATAAGLSHADFDAWVSMIGRPPGIVEALTLVNRKVMSKADFAEVVARSDVRTEYTDQLFELRHRYPSIFQLRGLISNGSVTDEYATQLLVEQGYSAKLAAGVVHAAHSQKTAHHKTLSLSLVERLYESGLETREWFEQALETLGYTPEDRAELERLLQAHRLTAEIQHALLMLRNRYVGWKIDRGAVVSTLDATLLDTALRDRLLALWDQEREANRPVLTTAQVGQALHVGRFTTQQALDRWVALGHSQEDAVTHAWIVLKRDPFAAPA